MKFWDSSALLPLIIQEKNSESILDLHSKSEAILIWTLTPVEIVSALSRLERMGDLSEKSFNQALEAWNVLKEGLYVVREIEEVKQRAIRLLRTHPLKAADSMQLAAALIAFADHPQGKGFVTLDTQLAKAASKEGFEVLPH